MTPFPRRTGVSEAKMLLFLSPKLSLPVFRAVSLAHNSDGYTHVSARSQGTVPLPLLT